jgi:hypothetical protein
VPITLLTRQRGWPRAETASAALRAGIGHVGKTLVLGLVVWLAGVAAADRFRHIVDTAASVALVAFGGWIAISAWRELPTATRASVEKIAGRARDAQFTASEWCAGLRCRRRRRTSTPTPGAPPAMPCEALMSDGQPSRDRGQGFLVDVDRCRHS